MNIKLFFSILIVIGLTLPFFALAGNLKGPIVPCGRCCNNFVGNKCVEPCPGVPLEQAQPCTLCHIFLMIQNIIDFILLGIFIIAPVFIIAGGIMILVAGAKPDLVTLGKQAITYAILGLVIALVSWTVLNVLFTTLVGKQGFPWPWNEIRCTGGEIAAPEEPSPPTTEKRMCTCGANSNLGSHLYNTAAECSNQCNSYCNINYSGAPGCCGTDVYLNGCSGQAVNRCSQMSAAGYCFGNNYYCQAGIKDQVSNSAGELDSLLDCMADRLPSGDARNISSIIDNSGGRCITNWTNPQCSGTTDSCTGTCCAHSQSSLHYGGTGCRGTSYAVDFATESAYSYIHDAAKACATSLNFGTVDVVLEGNHVHVELDSIAKAMGCK